MQSGNWNTNQKILVVLAHPDDPEFFCGATIAKWSHAGHLVVYCILTCGDKGTKDRYLNPNELCDIRQLEQLSAAKVLGVEQVRFLSYEDGYLTPSMELRRDITRVIRQEKPDILVTCDPTTLFIGNNYINHPDHRAAGQATIDAVYPAARDHLYFEELLKKENLEPHIVQELWLTGSLNPDVVLDITEFWEQKISAIKMHLSQIGDDKKLEKRLRARFTSDSTKTHPRFEEKFRRIVLK